MPIIPKPNILKMATLGALTVLIFGCAYYNYYYNARKYYAEGEKTRREQTASTSRRGSGGTPYDKCIESAGRMLEYYPDSRWEDDALLLLAKAFYHTGKYRNSIGKVDELLAKYPDTPFQQEANLWKGMSLLMVAQTDSALQILGRLITPETPLELSAQARFAIGDYYFKSQLWEAARVAFGALLASGIKDEYIRGEALLKLGVCLEKLNRYEDAITLYDDILKGKLSRRTKFEAMFQRGVALRETGASKEALNVFEKLGRDAAFQDRFPAVELETARCLIQLDRNDQARKRLEQLIETEKHGMVAAQAFFILGDLIWRTTHDLSAARTSLQGVRQAERNTPLGNAADSLISEAEQLSAFWQRLEFCSKQLALLDSAESGLRPMMPSDTVFVDSVAIILKRAESARSPSRAEARRRDPLKRMVEEASKAAQDSAQADSATVTAEVLPMDSSGLMNWRTTIENQLLETAFEFGVYHLLSRDDRDSARYYLEWLVVRDLSDRLWGQAVAALAQAARRDGNIAVRDSLYRLLLERLPDSQFAVRAREVLNIAPVSVATDTLALAFARAESLWLDAGETALAREVYLDLAAILDSASHDRARALFAAAYLTRRKLNNDTLALQMYQLVVDQFPNDPLGRSARQIVQRMTAAGGQPTAGSEELPTDLIELPSGESTVTTQPPPPDFEPDRIFTPDEVDEPPALTTSPAMLANYLRSYYPMSAFDEGQRGLVELEFVVNPSGAVSDVTISAVDPEGIGFETAALQIIERLNYRAGRYRGRPVAVKIKQRLNFEPN